MAPASDDDCYDISRSSSAPTTSAPNTANMQYYAYALDDVSFLVGSDATTGAGLAPGTPAQLTLQEVYNIYNCTYNNWDQVVVGYTPSGSPIKGANAPIYRFWPQSGSGTLAMAQNMLSSVALSKDQDAGKGFDPTVAAYNPPGSAAGDGGTNSNCVNGILGYAGPYVVEENQEANIADSAANIENAAIMPFSSGQFSAQWDDPNDYNSFDGPGGNPNFDPSLTIASLADLGNLTNDALPYVAGDTTVSPRGNQNITAPSPLQANFGGANGNPFVAGQFNATYVLNGDVVNEANEWYFGYGTVPYLVPGVRYLYNVVDTKLASYADDLQLVGFNNTGAAETVDGTTLPSTYVSPLCADSLVGSASTQTPAQIIQAAGFLPLSAVGGLVGQQQPRQPLPSADPVIRAAPRGPTSL